MKLSRDNEATRSAVFRCYAELWRALERVDEQGHGLAETADMLDQIRNALDRKASQLRPDRQDMLAGTFSIEGVVFKGDTSEIWQLRHRDLGSTHALKTIPAVLLSEVVPANLLRREAQTGIHLRHPNLLETAMLLRLDDGRPGILMPWQTSSLSSLPVTKLFSHQDAFDILQNVLLGLEAMHGEGIVHRDVTPSNIFLCESARTKAKLGDFGIALPTGATDADFGMKTAGSPEFAAPEQLRGAIAHPSQDFYAFGKVAARIAERMDAASPALEAVIAYCCRPDPEQRPANVRELLDRMSEA